MTVEPRIIILLDGDSSVYRPGEVLSGRYWIESFRDGRLKAVETSVLWHSEGKGDEDLAVHQFWRRDDDDAPIDPQRPERFRTVLPNSPLSYDGRIVKIRWCVRVRAFPFRGREIMGDKMFQLGGVFSAKAPSSSSDV